MLEIGEKLRNIRQEQGLSLRELAAKIDVSASLLSQIEHGKTNPSVQTLHSLADALSLPIDYFFPSSDRAVSVSPQRITASATASQMRLRQLRADQNGSQTTPPAARHVSPASTEYAPSQHGPILRSQDRAVIELQGNVTWSRLTASKERGKEFLEICYEAGATSGERMSHHRGREFILVLEGELTLDLAFERYSLRPGDSTIFDSATPHKLSNLADVPMRALSVIFELPGDV